jgi:hypothetical protein
VFKSLCYAYIGCKEIKEAILIISKESNKLLQDQENMVEKKGAYTFL